jgi:hypothetical protein
MAGMIEVICPTQQADKGATNWLDGQFAHDGIAEIARRAAGTRETVAGEILCTVTVITDS